MGMPVIHRGKPLDDCTQLYAPPVSEFAIQRITVPPSRSVPYELPAAPSAAIILCLSGSGTASTDGESRLSVRPSR
jgi:mannose-6-phosphate isomerase class I